MLNISSLCSPQLAETNRGGRDHCYLCFTGHEDGESFWSWFLIFKHSILRLKCSTVKWIYIIKYLRVSNNSPMSSTTLETRFQRAVAPVFPTEGNPLSAISNELNLSPFFFRAMNVVLIKCDRLTRKSCS